MAQKLGIGTAETLRKWVRQAETDGGRRAGVSTDESAELKRLGRDPGTISRELRRNAATCSGKRDYRASVAQWKAQAAARRPKPVKLVTNPRLKQYVQTRLSGQLQCPDGSVAPGPETIWKGLNKPHRADRRWATAWSPEQIAQRLVLDFPDDENMRISHETIYRAQASW